MCGRLLSSTFMGIFGLRVLGSSIDFLFAWPECRGWEFYGRGLQAGAKRLQRIGGVEELQHAFSPLMPRKQDVVFGRPAPLFLSFFFGYREILRQ